MRIVRYEESYGSAWNQFVAASKNGTFLLDRGYMDYHADRFADYSLLIFNEKGNLIALLPANVREQVFHSHQGLTYGGFVLSMEVTAGEVLEMFDRVADYLRAQGFIRWIYKQIPVIYHRYPAQEDGYALFCMNAQLIARGLSSTVRQENALKFRYNRRYAAGKAQKAGCLIRETSDPTLFWKILTENLLSTHGVAPVHTLAEMELLHSRFPSAIRCFEALLDGEVIAGAIVYETDTVAHTQYLSASPRGKETGALDLLLTKLIREVYASKEWFDFGVSTEQGGWSLNHGLLAQKEGFGARAVLYDTYQITL